MLLLSSLDPNEIKDMGVKSFNSMDELMKNVDLNGKDVYVIPYGGSLVPQLQETYMEFIDDLK